MAQIAKITAKAEIKSSSAKVHNFFKYNLTQITSMCPQIIKKAELLEGEEGQVGNVKLFEYVLGKTMTAKVKTTAMDDDEKSIVFVAIEGEIRNYYITFHEKFTAHDGYVEWSIEYEKANDSVPDPDNYAELAVEITKGADAYLLSH